MRSRQPSGRLTAPISRFSSTVSDGNTLSTCGTYARPCPAIALGRAPATSLPSSTTRPRDGRTSPNTAFISVDFPAPFGPISVTISEASTRIETPWSTSMAP